MKGRQLIVVEPGRIELQEFDLDAALQPHQALVEAEYSIVSAGTEGAGFTGLVREMPFGAGAKYPRDTGYGHLGRVLEVGSSVQMCRAGDRVLSFSRHASLVKADAVRLALPVPEDADGSHSGVRPHGRGEHLRAALLQRAAGRYGTGDRHGAGRQLRRPALPHGGRRRDGGRPLRLPLGQGARVRHRAHGEPRRDTTCRTRCWSGPSGEGVHVAVEAIGISEVVAQAVMATRRHGEVILLGSPRARATFDVTPMLLRIHLEAIRMIGSLEWRWPAHIPPNGCATWRPTTAAWSSGSPPAGCGWSRCSTGWHRQPTARRSTRAHQPQGRLPGRGIRLESVVRC